MKVAINAWFLNSTTTGSGQYVRNLLAALRATAPGDEFVAVEPRARGDAAKVWFEQSFFPRAAQSMQANVAFVPYWGPPLGCSVPVVATVHDVIPLALKQYRGRAQHRIYTSLVRASAASAAAILTDSEHSRTDIGRLLPVPLDRVSVVPLAADAAFTPAVPDADRMRAASRYDLPESYVLYIGGFDPRKNIETLLQVYVWCGETIGAEYPLVLSGMPDDRTWTREGAPTTLGRLVRELDLEDVVRFVGRVAEEDKPAVYAMARSFVFPSTYEGFGLPPLEAMACGVPVVGSNAASLTEVVGNAGMLTDPHNARQMAGSLIAVCTDDALHDRLAQRALLRAATYSWQRTALDTLAVLRRAAGQPRA